MSRFGLKRAPRHGVETCALGAPKCMSNYDFVRNVGLAVRETVLVLIKTTIDGRKFAMRGAYMYILSCQNTRRACSGSGPGVYVWA